MRRFGSQGVRFVAVVEEFRAKADFINWFMQIFFVTNIIIENVSDSVDKKSWICICINISSLKNKVKEFYRAPSITQCKPNRQCFRANCANLFCISTHSTV